MSRYVRATSASTGGGTHSLGETESAVAERLAGLDIDMNAMAAVSNVYRAANAIRRHVERTVLAKHDLTWTAWVVLWVVWIWGDIETRYLAAEAGISKGTLTGIVTQLEARKLLTRRPHPDDARRVLVALTPAGKRLMAKVFPAFNGEEIFVTETLSSSESSAMARSLRKVVEHLE